MVVVSAVVLSRASLKVLVVVPPLERAVVPALALSSAVLALALAHPSAEGAFLVLRLELELRGHVQLHSTLLDGEPIRFVARRAAARFC